jgi:protein TonB
MFDAVLNQDNLPQSRFGMGAVLSGLFHVGALALVLWISTRPHVEKEKGVAVKFMLPPPPPPPPLPLALKRATRVERVQHARRPETIVQPREVPKRRPPEAEPEEENEEQEGGVEGGVQGGAVAGVAGGVLGGVVGGMVGGTAHEAPKPKNVLPFVIQRDVLDQPQPRLSEVFKESHKNSGPISGMYRVCVGRDGHVFEVTPVKPIPGADEDIILGIREGWLYKPQQVPVCFLYNIPIILRH